MLWRAIVLFVWAKSEIKIKMSHALSTTTTVTTVTTVIREQEHRLISVKRMIEKVFGQWNKTIKDTYDVEYDIIYV